MVDGCVRNLVLIIECAVAESLVVLAKGDINEALIVFVGRVNGNARRGRQRLCRRWIGWC
jgi:hypothetical protein